jgi:hypothetical protein
MVIALIIIQTINPLDDMNLTFLLAGFGFVAIAGVLYYFTSKSDDFEETPKKETKEQPKAPVTVHDVNLIL